MELWDAFSYPFRLRRNRLTIVLGMLLLFLPIVGLVMWSGYLMRVMHTIIHGNEEELPEFDILGDSVKGVGLLLFNILYLLLPFILAFLTGLALGFILGESARRFLDFVLVFLYIFYVYSLLAFYIGRLNAASQDSTAPMWELRYNYRKVPAAFGWMLLVGFQQLVLSVCFVLVVLNMQSLLIWLAYLLPNVPILGLIFFGLFPISLAYVVISLQAAHLDSQLALRIDFND